MDKKPITIKNDIQRILVLGNTNRLDAKAIIMQYLNSTNEDVRRVALHQMENIQTKQ